jgi:hypothetical protein
VPGSFVALVTYHSDPFLDSDVLAVVGIRADGVRWARVVDIVRDEDAEACIAANVLEKYHAAAPSYAFRRGAFYCISVV